MAGDPEPDLASLITIGHPDFDLAAFISGGDPDFLGAGGLDYDFVRLALDVIEGLFHGGDLADFIVGGLNEDALSLPFIVGGLDEDALGANFVISGDPAAASRRVKRTLPAEAKG